MFILKKNPICGYINKLLRLNYILLRGILILLSYMKWVCRYDFNTPFEALESILFQGLILKSSVLGTELRPGEVQSGSFLRSFSTDCIIFRPGHFNP